MSSLWMRKLVWEKWVIEATFFTVSVSGSETRSGSAGPWPVISFFRQKYGSGSGWGRGSLWGKDRNLAVMFHFLQQRKGNGKLLSWEWESEHVAVQSRVPQCLFWELFSAMDEEAKSPRRQSPFFHPNHSFQKQQAYPKVLRPRL